MEEVATVFRRTGRWPVWQYIDRVLDRAGFDGLRVLAEVTDDAIQKPSRIAPESEIRLTVSGLSATTTGRPEVSLFLDVLSWATSKERDFSSESAHIANPHVLTSQDYGADRKRRRKKGDAVTITKAYLLLSVEGLTGSGGSNLAAGEWSTAVDERIRPFRGVKTLRDYQLKKAELAREHLAFAATVRTPSPVLDTPRPHSRDLPDPSRVFVVHGRNVHARDAVFEFIRALGLRPIEWSQAVQLTGKGSPYVGEILDAAFLEAQAVVILMTPDEIAYLRSEYSAGEGDAEAQPAPQARPNVLFEAGMAMGRDTARAILVELGAVRPFSDIAGRHAVRLDGSAARRKELAQRLQTAGCSVDTSGSDWLTAGDFSPPEPPGGGLPLGKRLPASEPRSRVKIDLRYHDRTNSGRLEIINMGTEAVYDLDLQLPPGVDHFHLVTDELPLAKLPPGKSAKLVAYRTNVRGRDHFEVSVVGHTADGEAVSQDVFLSLLE